MVQQQLYRCGNQAGHGGTVCRDSGDEGGGFERGQNRQGRTVIQGR